MPSSHRPVPACVRRSPSPGRTGRTARTGAAVMAAGASLALLAGCASATGGSGPAAAGALVPVAATSAAAGPTLAGLATRVAAAVAGATSVHVAGDLSGVAALPVHLGAVEGDLALAAGRPTAIAVTAGGFALRHVADTTWVSLPGSAAATPWTLVSRSSSNPIVAMAAGRLADLEKTIGGIDPTALLGAAADLRLAGPADVDGTAATRYTFSVDPSVIRTALGVDAGAAGGHTVAGNIPVQVWLDAADRPLRVTATPTVDGKAAAVTVTLSAWNAPVSITAPDPSQVGR